MISQKAGEDTVMRRRSTKSVRVSGRAKITKDDKEKESAEPDKEAV